MAVSFIGGGNRSTRRKPLICRKSLTNFITCCFEYTLPWTGLKLTTLVVTGPDSTSSCKSNYYTTTTMMAPYTDQYKYWWCNQTNAGSASGPYGSPVVKRVGEVRLFGKHFVNKCQNRKEYEKIVYRMLISVYNFWSKIPKTILNSTQRSSCVDSCLIISRQNFSLPVHFLAKFVKIVF